MPAAYWLGDHLRGPSKPATPADGRCLVHAATARADHRQPGRRPRPHAQGPGRPHPAPAGLNGRRPSRGEACVCELTEPLGLTQPTISHHLKILVDAGIFTRDKRGVWAYYALVPSAMDALSAMLSTTR